MWVIQARSAPARLGSASRRPRRSFAGTGHSHAFSPCVLQAKAEINQNRKILQDVNPPRGTPPGAYQNLSQITSRMTFVSHLLIFRRGLRSRYYRHLATTAAAKTSVNDSSSPVNLDLDALDDVGPAAESRLAPHRDNIAQLQTVNELAGPSTATTADLNQPVGLGGIGVNFISPRPDHLMIHELFMRSPVV